MSEAKILERLSTSGRSLVEVTGGEPLSQSETPQLLKSLCDTGCTVLLETSGAESVEAVDPRVHVVMDVKCPDSLVSDSFVPENLDILFGKSHELKFVISSKNDFDWAVSFVKQRGLTNRNLLLSPVPSLVTGAEAAEWILGSGIEFRMQLQLHKLIWPEGGDDR